MNRSIKFRNWDMATNKFHDNKPFDEILNDIFIKERFVFQQFTGLLDKTGHEIYEGDILRIQTEDDPEDLQWEIAPIVFKNACFLIKGVYEQPLWDWIIEGKIDSEVIGNIFENPELTEELNLKDNPPFPNQWESSV